MQELVVLFLLRAPINQKYKCQWENGQNIWIENLPKLYKLSLGILKKMLSSINKKRNTRYKTKQRDIILLIRLSELNRSIICRSAGLKVKGKIIFLEENMVLPIKDLDAYTPWPRNTLEKELWA